MYRPQFVYPPTPKGCLDQRCSYSFDQSNTPYFNGTIAAGALIQKIPLQLDQDAAFFIRAIEVQATGLLVGLEDTHVNPLLQPTAQGQPPTLLPALWCEPDGAGIVALETDNWGIFCPAGGVLNAYISNPTAGPIAGPVILLHGIKRYTGEQCK